MSETIDAATCSTLTSILELRASESPDTTAYIWLSNGEEETDRISYRELCRRSLSIAGRLQRDKTPEIAALLYPSGLDFIAALFGCMYAGVTAVPLHLPRYGRPTDGLQGIFTNCAPGVVLTASESQKNVDDVLRRHLRMDIPIIATDSLNGDALTRKNPECDGSKPAYIQYTSGSTSAPRGVVISHNNLIHNMKFIDQGFLHDSRSLEVCWLPPFHDMGLVYGILQPVYSGFTSVLMAPAAFVERPLRWLKAISKYRATHSGGPNFAYDLCTRSKPETRLSELELSNWRIAFSGAEPVVAETLDRFAAAFGEYGFEKSSFYPAYGLAESTLKVSGGKTGEGPTIEAFDSEAILKGIASLPFHPKMKRVRLVSCGKVSNDGKTIVVDPESKRIQPENRVGEIWTRGASVGAGYLNCPEETERVFHALTEDKSGPYLRTGDLGFFREGMLFVTGRIKDLIIVNGKNYYPQDIERALDNGDSHIKPGAALAFSVRAAGDRTEDVIVVIETRAKSAIVFEQIASAIRLDVLSAVGLAPAQIIGVDPGTLPRTSSGKLRRSACKSSYVDGSLASRFRSEGHAALWADRKDAERLPTARSESGEVQDEIEAGITTIVAEALGVNGDDIDIYTDLADLGLESISMLRLATRLQEEYSIAISIPDLLRHRTVRNLARYVVQLRARPLATSASATSEGDEQHQRLGYAQQSLLYQHHLAERPDALNITRAVGIEGELREETLQEALGEITRRHRVLRSAFPNFPNDESVEISPVTNKLFPLRRIKAEPEHLDSAIRAAATEAFNPNEGMLFRVHLIESPGFKPVLVFVLHHSICDLWSLILLFDELWSEYRRLMNGDTGPGTHHRRDFYDHVQDQQAFLGTPAGADLRSYWKRAARPDLPPLTVTEKPQVRQRASHKVGYKQFGVEDDTIKAGAACAAELKISMAELYFGLFQIVMSYHSGLSAFRVGMSTHGRSRPDDAQLLGCMVNILPIAATIQTNWTVKQVLRQAGEASRAAREHGDYPFYLNVQQIAEDAPVQPAVEVIFHFYKTAMSELDGKLMPIALGHSGHEIEAHGVKLVTKGLYHEAGQHQLTFSLGQLQDALIGTIEWSEELLTGELVDNLLSQYCNVLRQLPAHVHRTVGELLCAADHSLQRHRDALNATRVEAEAELLHTAFERRVMETPRALAVIGDTGSLTYEELDVAADALAQTLRDRGAGPDVVVGLCADRSEVAIIGMIGVVKAGAAYMPIDPEYPNERIARIVTKSRCGIVVTAPALEERIRGIVSNVICIRRGKSDDARLHRLTPRIETCEQNLAYVMFTSGSTGDPKGVMIDHRAICNRLRWMQKQYHLQREDRVFQKTPYTFDVSVWEVFWPLSAGAAMVLARPNGHRDPTYLAESIDKHEVSVAHFVPSMLREFLDTNHGRTLPSLQRIICSGEGLPRRVARECLDSQPVLLENLYGPTEAAIDVTSCSVRLPAAGEEIVSIGSPIDNVQVYVLDEMMYPVPTGRAGELFLGGIALARGYASSPGLTAERFLPDPYGPPGGRLYQTGDLVRLDSSGVLHFIGRKDRQVKLRGQRVELGEIEVWIRSHPEVRDATVEVLNASMPSENLVAFIITTGAEERVIQEVYGTLKAALPPYMVPARFVPMQMFPLTTSGKIDHKMLLLPTTAGSNVKQDSRNGEGPANEIEDALLNIWRDVLQIQDIGLHDGFFSLGGHSLAATQVISRVRKRLSIQLPLSVIFSDDATITTLAEEIAARRRSPGPKKSNVRESPVSIS